VTEKKSLNRDEKVEVLKKQLNSLFEHYKLEKEKNQVKEIFVTQSLNDQKSSKSIQILELKESVKPTTKKESEVDQTKIVSEKKETTEKVFCCNFVEKGNIEEKKPEQQTSQIEAKEKFPTQLNIKFNEEIGFDHSITSPTSKLPDNAPTFILVGDRFVREDKVLIDLDINDLSSNNSLSSNTKPSQMKLPLELQGIDYEGWYMQQIVEEYQNNLKTNNNQPKV
jgi:hypothetical protein